LFTKRPNNANRQKPHGILSMARCGRGIPDIMSLDLPTLMVMQSFALASAGALLFFAWLENRSQFAVRLWGAGHIMAAVGILCLMLGFTSRQPAWLGLGGSLLSPVILGMEGGPDH
jgi:hypothetical protein